MERERLEVTSRARWRAWLEEHHATSPGIWLVTWKKAAGDRHVSYEEIVREALCFGWVDSQAKGVDAERTSITMTPRRPGSRWTQRNRERVEELEAAGLMTPAGRAEIDAARANGAWDELRDVEALVEPDDLRAVLDADPAARARWEALTPSAKFQHLLRLHDTKRAETRARHVDRLVSGLHEGVSLKSGRRERRPARALVRRRSEGGPAARRVTATPPACVMDGAQQANDLGDTSLG